MDSELQDFLRIIGDIIRTNGAEYQNKKQFKFIEGKGGQLSIRYSPLLNQHPSLRIYLRLKKNDGGLQNLLTSCKIHYDGRGDSQNICFYTSCLVLIDKKLIDVSKFKEISTQTEDIQSIEISSSSTQTTEEVNCDYVGIVPYQFKKKAHYHPFHVQHVYKESGLQHLEERFNTIICSRAWNTEMKYKCTVKLLNNIRRAAEMHVVDDKYSDYVAVCSSIKDFIGGLELARSDNKHVADYVTVACGYRNALSSRRLSAIIGTNREHIDHLKKKINERLTVSSATVDDNEEDVDEDVLDEEPPSSDEDSIGDEDSLPEENDTRDINIDDRL